MTRRLGLTSTLLLCSMLNVIRLTQQSNLIRPIPGMSNVNFSRPGDLNLGVLMSVHKYDKDALCGNTLHTLNRLALMEAIVFAVEEINNRSDILPNVSLGFTILDCCSNELAALARAVHFIQDTHSHALGSARGVSQEASVLPVQAEAVITTMSSQQTTAMASLLSLFEVPTLSYYSTSSLLDNQLEFSYFSRIVPSDSMQAKAIADIIVTFGWTYVSFMYSEGSYGTEGFRTVQGYLESYGFCLAVTVMLSRTYEANHYTAAVKKLMATPQAKVVVLFTDAVHSHSILCAISRMGLYGKFTFVGSDAVRWNVQLCSGIERVVAGMLKITFTLSPVERFDQRFRHMTLRTGSRNPWFAKFFSRLFDCKTTLRYGPGSCDLHKEIMEAKGYRPSNSAALPITAVYAYAYALHAIVKNCKLADVKQCVKPKLLVDTLRTVSFSAEGLNISFDKTGNGQINYLIFNYVLENSILLPREVGEWDNTHHNFSFFDKSKIRWNPFMKRPPPTADGEEVPPKSVCSEPCAPFEQAVVTQPSCCFYCDACRENERVVTAAQLQHCERCPVEDNFTWPDEARKECLPIPATFLRSTQLEGLAMLSVDLLVFVMACTTTFLFISNGNNPLIKASSPEVSIMMLIGHMLTCILVVTFLVEPTMFTCIITDVGFNLSLTMSYGTLLVKLDRIYRVQKSGTKPTEKPKCVTPRAQVVFAFILICIQVLLQCITMVIEPPMALTVMPNIGEKLVERVCSDPAVGFSLSVCFNLLLMVVCTVFAFKTRSLSDNFYETKFIMFCIYTTVLMWLSFLPTYFTATDYTVQAACLATTMIFSVISMQVFLFLPKIYAVYFVPKENIHFIDSSASNGNRL